MRIVIRPYASPEGMFATFENGLWRSNDPQLKLRLNELFRQSPIPANQPDPESYVIDWVKSYLPHMEVLESGDSEPLDSEKLPKWLRFLTGE